MTPQVKILVIGSRIPFPLYDGGAIATYNMLKGLSQNGVGITYVSLNTSKHFVDDVTIRKEFGFLEKIRTFEIDTGIRVTAALKNLFSGSSYNIDRFYNIDFEKMLLDEISAGNYDVIHFEGLFVARYVREIRKVSRIPTILRQHNVEYRIWERLAENELNPVIKWYLKLLARRIKAFETSIVNEFDRIVTIADSDEDQMKEWENIKSISTIPIGLELPEHEPSLATPWIKDSIYHIGSMEWMPNMQAMEWFYGKVWPVILNTIPTAQFYMAGKNMPDKYKDWASDHFHVLGEVKDVRHFSGNKQILIVPLLSASGIRIKTIEAMILGKPVVTTTIGAHGLPIKNLEHCMIADNPDDFANAVIYLLLNPDERAKIAENGRKTITTLFEFNSIARQWISLYESMLRN